MSKTRINQMANWAVEAAMRATSPQTNVDGDAAEIIRRALSERDKDQRWKLVTQLHRTASREILDAALGLCHGATARKRALGADILAQICGAGQFPWQTDSAYYEERLAALLRLVEDKRVSVLVSAACGLGQLTDTRAIDALVALRGHPNRRVRRAVVFGLLQLEDERAIRALVELSEDVSSDVRDWATFGLGSQIESDTPEVRNALAARIDDPDYETRCEAIVGLARRKDMRATAPLLSELGAEYIGMLSLEAAEELGVPALLPALLELKETWDADGEPEDDWNRCLARAIAACGGATSKTGT